VVSHKTYMGYWRTRVLGYSQQNIIVDNILTEQEIQDVYNHIDSTPEERRELVRLFSHKAYHGWMPQNVIDSITRAAQSTTDVPLVLREISFARYEKYEEGLPVQLIPHSDETFREHRLTFDVQLRSNRDWAIVVEGKSFTLKDNQALTFSGTSQIHWREKTEFKDGDFVDMIFAHFSAQDYIPYELGVRSDSSLPPESEHDILMSDKQKDWEKIYNES